MSKNKSMTIIEFLEARIAEDEKVALPGSQWLAECAGKRAIIKLNAGASVLGDWKTVRPEAVMIRALAALYKDHPDYRQEWAL